MEGRKLLDAGVFTEQQEIDRPNVPNFVFPWNFEIFVFSHSFKCTWS